MTDRKAAFIHSPELERYNYPPDCPFNTQRAGIARRVLASMGMLTGEDRFEHPPVAADRDALERLHTPRYLDALKAFGEGHWDLEALGMGLGTPECPAFKGMYEYAALACGATLAGAELILAGRAAVAFNPSGGYHHAGPEEAAGFCYVNDVAIACMALAEKGRRVFFLDVDAHHGDGVQNAFHDRADVMTLSIHESGKTLFPGTGFESEIGVGEGEGYCANLPLPEGTYDEIYIDAFRAVALPLLGAYDPDIVVLELGLDGLAGDPLAHMSLTNNVYAEIVEMVLGFGKPVLATGGGGYHAENTARGWALAWCTLCGETGQHDMSIGLGGVMLESTDWLGGLRDRALIPDHEQRRSVDTAVHAAVEAVKRSVFRYHGL